MRCAILKAKAFLGELLSTNHVNNALGEEGVRILMMVRSVRGGRCGRFSRVTCGSRIGVCTVMST